MEEIEQSKKILIKFEIFRSNLISVGNVFRINFKIISGSVQVYLNYKGVSIRNTTCRAELQQRNDFC